MALSDIVAADEGDASVIEKGTGSAGYPDNCGMLVNNPHNSYSTDYPIHARSTSLCRYITIISNSVSGKMYRGRWYGWQKVADLPARTVYGPSSTAQNYRRAIVHSCPVNSRFRYRAEGFGTILTPTGTYSASAYEQNDSELTCIRCRGAASVAVLYGAAISGCSTGSAPAPTSASIE